MSGRKILILSNRVPYPLKDGGAMAMDAMIRGYHARGWKVYVLAMNTSRHFVDEAVANTLYPQIESFKVLAFNNDVTVGRILKNLLGSRNPEHVDRFYSRAFEHSILEEIKAIQPGFIQVESIYLSAYIPAIRKVTTAKLILRLHNIEAQIWQRLALETKSYFKKVYLSVLANRMALYEPKAWQLYDLLVPITAADAAFVAKKQVRGLPQVVIPYGLSNLEFSGSDVSQADIYKAYHLGAMDWLPNQEAINWFIDVVFPKLKAAQPSFTFTFAGRNMPQSYMERHYQQGLNCMAEVADAQQFIKDKFLLIVPLKSGGGLRIKIIEAMAMGKLVLSTSIGVQGIEAESGKELLIADTAEEYVAQINWIYSNIDKARAIARQGQEFVKNKYDNTALMQQLTDKITLL